VIDAKRLNGRLNTMRSSGCGDAPPEISSEVYTLTPGQPHTFTLPMGGFVAGVCGGATGIQRDIFVRPGDGGSFNDNAHIGLLNRGRIGESGQAVNTTINCLTTPYVKSNIIFSAARSDGSFESVWTEIFPTYSIYVDGTKVSDEERRQSVS